MKVETIAPAHVAYQRIAGVLEQLATTLQPVSFILYFSLTFVAFRET